jgi:hypothetical protein
MVNIMTIMTDAHAAKQYNATFINSVIAAKAKTDSSKQLVRFFFDYLVAAVKSKTNDKSYIELPISMLVADFSTVYNADMKSVFSTVFESIRLLKIKNIRTMDQNIQIVF